MSRPRFHIPGIGPGARSTLPDHSAHHARDVLRLRSGMEVTVFDGAGAEYEAVLEAVTRQEVRFHLGAPIAPRPESPLHLTLALPPLKGDRMETVIQKATELGVAVVRPVITARTDAVARPALKGSRQERWDKVASGAAEQCGRAVVPDVASTTTLAPFLAEPLEGLKLLFLETPGHGRLHDLPQETAVCTALVGPAGGWEAHEVEKVLDAGYTAVSFGPRILRAETAAIAIAAALQILWGDLG